jgi:DNA segregation ATPase FtsK/SpoIIIE, S-DNA-T family
MADKKTKASSKNSASKKSPTAVKKNTKSKKASSKSRSGSSSARQAPRRPSKASPKVSAPSRQPMSLDRKLDFLGVGLALVGLLTLLSLLSPIKGSLTGTWVTFIGKIFGWGMYILPFGLLIGGLWLVLRSFERIPHLKVSQVIGIVLLFLSLLAGIHFITGIQTKEDLFELAEQSKGGGYIGAAIVYVLQAALGKGGAAIVLLALTLVSLALTFDVTIFEMLNWLGKKFAPIKAKLVAGWNSLLHPRQAAPSVSLDPDFTPLHRPLPESIAGAVTNPATGSAFTTLTPETSRPWVLPIIDQILDAGEETPQNDDLDRQRARLIEETLQSFGAPVHVIEVNRGPTITQFGVEPDFLETRNGRTRVRVAKIVSLADDLALALSARSVRIQAPVPGKGFVGIEVPNDRITPVMLRDVLESETFRRIKTPLRFAMGQNVAGQSMVYDLASMPHLLIAGATGSGKSVCVNALICCLIMNNTPDELRLIMVDPKRVELSGYNGIPHLLAPVVVELEKVVAVLQWVTREMDMRYRKLSEAGARNIQEFNLRVTPEKKLPFLVVIIDELADLMMLAPDETERTITRLAQLARATGIHIVIATQRPSVEVVTGLIKANFPARVAFAVASNTDSRVILDQPGAERLLGRGDMLFQAPDSPAPVRLQGVFVSDAEILRLVSYWQSFAGTATTSQTAAGGTVDALPTNIPLKQLPIWEEIEQENEDPLFKEAVELSRRQGRASISMLQRRLRIGYTRAARIVERMEEKGIVGPPEPSTGTREILDYGDMAPPVEAQRD